MWLIYSLHFFFIVKKSTPPKPERKLSASTSKKPAPKKVEEMRKPRKRRLSGELSKSESESVFDESSGSEVSFPLSKKVFSSTQRASFTAIFMPPTSKKFRGHIGLGLSMGLCICYTCMQSRMVRDGILKFDTWNNHEILTDPCFISFSSDLSLQSYAPFSTFFDNHC